MLCSPLVLSWQERIHRDERSLVALVAHSRYRYRATLVDEPLEGEVAGEAWFEGLPGSDAGMRDF